MSKRSKTRPKTRDEPQKSTLTMVGGQIGFLTSEEAWQSLACAGYTKLSQNPEVLMCVHKIADIISSMTIHLMRNALEGDVREKNALSHKVDVEPCSFMTRKGWVYHIVRSMLLEGDGNAFVLPSYDGDYLEELTPIPPDQCSILPAERGYTVMVRGIEYSNDELLHFVLNPDIEEPYKGAAYRVQLREIVQNLRQATKTKNAFMASEWKPSLIVKVDALSDNMANEEGRNTILERYAKSSKQGEPWVIPADLLDVKDIKPLTLNDLALNDTVQIDKRTVAGIFGVPAYIVGVGQYNKDEYNGFIKDTILPIAKSIEQELTRKLLYSPELYFRFNPRSMYAYDVSTLADIGMEMAARGLMTGNEARDWIGLPPLEGLDELLILENFVPIDRLGDQKKLRPGGGKSGRPDDQGT